MKLLLLLSIYCIFLLLIISQESLSQSVIVLDSTESRCAATGTVTVQANGGVAPYRFQIKTQGDPDIAYSAPTSDTLLTGLSAGTYVIRVEDDNNNLSF